MGAYLNSFHALVDRQSPSQIAELRPNATNRHHFSSEGRRVIFYGLCTAATCECRSFWNELQW
jgi:hypothetical protein